MKKIVLQCEGSKGVFLVERRPKNQDTLALPKKSCVHSIEGTPKDLEGNTFNVKWTGGYISVRGENELFRLYKVI